MLGAICGDFVGSVYEFNPTKDPAFPMAIPGSIWTDDSALTVAVAEAIMERPDAPDFERHLVAMVRAHPWAGYGPAFRAWALRDEREQQDSWGNGSAMRVSAIAWLAPGMADVATLARASALPSHSHQHGIRGALATAVMGRAFLEGASPQEARSLIECLYGYDLSRVPDDIRPGYSFKVSCRRSVPEAMCCVLAASSWEEAVRLAVSLGGDADTQGAIAGGIAAARFGEDSIPPALADKVKETLPDTFIDALARFDVARSQVSLSRSDWGRLERWHEADFAEHPADESGAKALAALQAMQDALAPSRSAPNAGALGVSAPRKVSAWLSKVLDRRG